MTENAKRVMLDLNVSAPQFNITDTYGRQINLTDYKGKKVLVAFFRHAGCPFCNMRAHTLRKNYEALKAQNLEMIFFFESPQKALQASLFHQEISPIPLISDPEKVWYQTYGIESSATKSMKSHLTSFIQSAIKAKMNNLPIHPMKNGESLYTIPAEFLLDEKLIIRKIHYANSLTDRFKLDELYEFAKS